MQDLLERELQNYRDVRQGLAESIAVMAKAMQPDKVVEALKDSYQLTFQTCPLLTRILYQLSFPQRQLAVLAQDNNQGVLEMWSEGQAAASSSTLSHKRKDSGLSVSRLAGYGEKNHFTTDFLVQYLAHTKFKTDVVLPWMIFMSMIIQESGASKHVKQFFVRWD